MGIHLGTYFLQISSIEFVQTFIAKSTHLRLVEGSRRSLGWSIEQDRVSFSCSDS